MSKDILLFGVQGSGKGTQAERLESTFGYVTIGMGNALREMSRQESPLGQQIKKNIEEGELVTEEIVAQVVEEMIHQKGNAPLLFDGYPRTLTQYQHFEAVMQKMGRAYTGIYIELSREEAIARIAGRKICGVCHRIYLPQDQECKECHIPLVRREDDKNVESVTKRIDLFMTETLPVVETMDTQGRMKRIKGELSIEEVEQAISHCLREE